MTTGGFYFKRLEARGRDVETAVLEMSKGLNVISGASDTGKSYLVHCLNFMTGSTKPPKPISEGEGYETLWLEIITWSGDVFTLERSLRGKDFGLYRCAMEDVNELGKREVLKEKRGKGSSTSISEFLLGLCKLQNVQLRTNADGNLRPLSFRDFAHLSVINEERIYTEGSPVRASGQFVSKTVEESFFKYLLTGVDDSSVIVAGNDGETAGHRRARLEAIEEIIESIEETLLELTPNPTEIHLQLARLKASAEQTTTAIALDRDRLREEQTRRQTLWSEINKSTTRIEVLSRLVNRFALLDRHYESDLKRLLAMSEVGKYLTELPQADCPLCGTVNPWGSDDDLDQARRACISESEKIALLREDLKSTVIDLQQELTSLDRSVRRSQRSYRHVTQQIEDELLPAEEVSRQELSILLETTSRLERAAALADQMDKLRLQISEIDDAPEKPRKRSAASQQLTAAKTSETSDFCKTVEILLEQWSFPNAGRVTFSETNQDLVVNGKDRASHGKGIRALSYAAFVVGLLRFCREKMRCHPGFVVLDSPLVAYREPDSKREVEKAGIRESFYRSLAKRMKDVQVVIFENEDPPDDIKDKIQYVHFSGDEDGPGQSGFFPVRGS
jgi:hypothetical protein